jgi:hypothetical protein
MAIKFGGVFGIKDNNLKTEIMEATRGNVEKERFSMAIDRIDRPDNFERVATPTTEEHEKKKKELALKFSKELIDNFTPEDRFDIFNDVRRELETHLRGECEDMFNDLNRQKERFELLTNIIY